MKFNISPGGGDRAWGGIFQVIEEENQIDRKGREGRMEENEKGREEGREGKREG